MATHGQPLGLAWDTYFGARSSETGWRKAWGDWSAICSELGRAGSGFSKTLSVSQKKSSELLLEWWNGDIDRNDTSAAVRDAFEGGPSDEQLGPILKAHCKSPYHRAMLEVFVVEFLLLDIEAAVVLDKRAKAGRIAACQRVAHMTYRLYRDETLSISAKTIQGHGELPGELAVYPIPDLASLPSNEWCLAGAVLDPCPWLPADAKSGLPYYLWDIEAKKTVVVHELDKVPSYTVISHTWGRWRVPDTEPDHKLRLPGVPWLVPRNTRFRVDELPGVFFRQAASFAPTRYLWFDLFCIPQDGSAISKQEIARQAAIFSSAYCAICWLNTITDWTGLQSAVRWLAWWYLQDAEGADGETQRIWETIQGSLATETQLFAAFLQNIPGHPSKAVGWGRCEWFTSLWTLQEVCLRPGMHLADKDWNLLMLSNEHTGTRIPLDVILELTSYFQAKHGEGVHSQAIEELGALVSSVCLIDLVGTSPLAILVAGERRVCEKRRAEAIMSAIGATSWYKRTHEEMHEKDLVLGKYPINFLREIRDQHGAKFFSTLFGFHCAFWDIFSVRGENDATEHTPQTPSQEIGAFIEEDDGSEWEDVLDEIDLTVAGTMLPLSLSHADSKIVGKSEIRWHDDPTTASWQLGDDGRVIMPTVAILASTDPSLAEGVRDDLTATVCAPRDEDPKSMQLLEAVCLQDWLCGLFAGQPFAAQPRHAISILWGDAGLRAQGAILMKVLEDEEPSRTFAKVGDFFIGQQGNTVKPQVCQVDWEVL